MRWFKFVLCIVLGIFAISASADDKAEIEFLLERYR